MEAETRQQYSSVEDAGNAAETRLAHRLQVDAALISASRMLLSPEPVSFEKLLGDVGAATGADSAYLVLLPPDEQLTEPLATPVNGMQDASMPPGLPALPDLLTPGSNRDVITWRRADAAVDGIGRSVSAVPVLSRHGRLFGYLGFEFGSRPNEWMQEDSHVLSVLGDLISAYAERMLAEEALRTSEDRWRQLVEHNPEPILIVRAGRILYVNPSGSRLLGANATADVQGRSLYDFVSAEEIGLLEHQVEAFRKGSSDTPVEQTVIRFDGEERIVEWFAAPVTYAGRPAAQVVLRDITERKMAERSLQESEGRFRNLADSAPVMIWMTGADALCTYVNQGWLRFTGRNIEHEIGNGWMENVHPDDLAHCLNVIEAHVGAQQPFRIGFRMRRADGAWRWVINSGVPRHTNDGAFLGYIGSCLDITEQREAMEAVAESEERYRTFVGTIAEAIWRLEMTEPVNTAMPEDLQSEAIFRNARLAECNEGMARLVGASDAQALIGHKLAGFVPCVEGTLVEAFIRNGYRFRNQEYTIYQTGEQTRHYVINAVGTVEDGALVRIWGSCIEVTDQVELEQQMVAALEQQQQRFGRDLHDGLGQLLTAVRMLSNNLADRLLNGHEETHALARKVARFAEEASQRIREIYSGLAPFQLYQDGLSLVLRDLAQDVDSIPGIKCIYRHDGVADVSDRDAMLHLYRIAQEATNNALKYAQASRIIISLRSERDQTVLTIEDNGTGFDVASRRGGRSIGLRSMYYRARAIGGTLSIESRTTRPRTGTTVRCVLTQASYGNRMAGPTAPIEDEPFVH